MKNWIFLLVALFFFGCKNTEPKTTTAIPKIEKDLKIYEDKIDEHHKMIFYYKFASLHFGVGNNKVCIAYLNKIISNKSLSMREDLLCFSRVLNLVAHYEAGLDYHLETLLKSTYKFLIKMFYLNFGRDKTFFFC